MLTVEKITARLKRIEAALHNRYGSNVYFATAHIHTRDASVSLFSYRDKAQGGNIDEAFKGKNVEDALLQAEAWVARDEVAEINLTLGLTIKGKYDERNTDSSIAATFVNYGETRCRSS